VTVIAGAVPVPVREITVVPPAALCEIVMVAVRGPTSAASGWNVALIVVLLPGSTVIGNVEEVKAKSPGLLPPRTIPLRVSEPVPVFVTVTVSGVLVVPTLTLPKGRIPFCGEMPIFGTRPVPWNVTLCAGPALLPTVRTAERAPPPLGLKTKFTDVFLPAEIVSGRVGAADENVNSALLVPEMARLEIIRSAVPVLLIVSVWA